MLLPIPWRKHHWRITFLPLPTRRSSAAAERRRVPPAYAPDAEHVLLHGGQWPRSGPTR